MTQMNRAAVLETLETTPHRIASVTRRLSDGELNWKPAADSWSVNEVLAHLRCCADVWGESIRKILKQDQPTFRCVSPRGWIKKTNYLELDFKASYLAFNTQREELLSTLRPLPAEDWSRRANVKAGTKVREETVLSYAQRLANHESGQFDLAHVEHHQRKNQRAVSGAAREGRPRGPAPANPDASGLAPSSRQEGGIEIVGFASWGSLCKLTIL